MSCGDLPDRLSAYADGELAPRERGAVEAHLEGCPACRGQLALLRRASTGLKRWFERVDDSLPDVAASRDRLLASSLEASAEAAGRRQSRWRRLGAGVFLAAIAAAALAAILWPPLAARRLLDESCATVLDRGVPVLVVGEAVGTDGEPRRAFGLVLGGGSLFLLDTPEPLGFEAALPAARMPAAADRSWTGSDGTVAWFHREGSGAVQTLAADPPALDVVFAGARREADAGRGLAIVQWLRALEVIEGARRGAGTCVRAGTAMLDGESLRVIEVRGGPPEHPLVVAALIAEHCDELRVLHIGLHTFRLKASAGLETRFHWSAVAPAECVVRPAAAPR